MSTCKYCSRQFLPMKSSKGIYCSYPCVWADKKASISLECAHCSQAFTAWPSAVKRGKRFCSNPCRARARKGAAAGNWRGGRSTERTTLMSRQEYKDWRIEVFTKDFYKCSLCGETKGIQAHHIMPWALYPELRYEVFNGKTLCGPCHKDTDLSCRTIFSFKKRLTV